MSSGSSRGWPSPRLGSPSKTRINNGHADGRGQVAFRRTYSSNSIKVREVNKSLLHPSLVIVDRISGRSRAIKFPQS
jgi:hypothetical protein